MRQFCFFTVAMAVVAVAYFFFSPTTLHSSQEILEPFPLGPSLERSHPPQAEEHGPEGSIAAFQRLTEEALDRLPRNPQFKGKSADELHFTPSAIMEMGPTLARIGDSLRAHPDLVPQGIEFYENCAQNPEVVAALRTICLRDLKYWTGKQPEVTLVRESDYPAEIWHISNSLPAVIP